MQGYGGVEAALDQLIKRAQRDLIWSRAFLYIGAGIGLLVGLLLLISSVASTGQTGGGTGGSIAISLLVIVGGTLFFAYDLWANYWGWITLWRWYWRTRTGDIGAFLALLALIVITGGGMLLLISLIAGWYGVLGGGIYQYRKAKQIIAAARSQGFLATN